MSVKVGEGGRRSVQVEVEVPGSPEEVWQAIATGPGISSWFVPAQVDEREGGEIVQSFGPGMESTSTISEWQPPHRYVTKGEGMGEGAPAVADEWIVEAKAGGTCVVRVVHSWFASTDDWDGQFEAIEQGWATFFRILQLRLSRFHGQPSAGFQAAAMASLPFEEARTTFAGPLGLVDAAAEKEVVSEEGAPKFAGTVDSVRPDSTLVLLREPASGIANLMAMPMGEGAYLSAQFFLFGEAASEVVTGEEPKWQGWMSQVFPSG